MKNLRVDSGGTLTSTKKLKRVLSKLKYGKGSADQITADVLKELPRDCLEKRAISVRDVLGHELPIGMDGLFDDNGTKSCGCNEPCQVQADRCIVRDEKNLGYIWLNSLPPLRYESSDCVCAEDRRGCWVVFWLLKAAELSREWQTEVVVVQLNSTQLNNDNASTRALI